MKRQGVSISAVDNAVDPVAHRLGGLFKGQHLGACGRLHDSDFVA